MIRFNAVNCKNDSTIISNVDCGLAVIKRNQKGLQINMTFLRDIRKPRLALFLSKTTTDKKEVVLLDVRNFDGCQFFENKVGFGILQIVRNELEKYASFPRKCPLAKVSTEY